MSANAGDVVAIVAVFLTFGLVISTWETGAPDEFNRLKLKTRNFAIAHQGKTATFQHPHHDGKPLTKYSTRHQGRNL